MEDKLPEIYWYLFWIGLVIIFFTMAYLGGRGNHQLQLKTLDILRMYAEKGAEPPPAIVERLTHPMHQHRPAPHPPAGSRAAFMMGFLGFLFSACVAMGLTIWLSDSGGPKWALYAAQAAWAFFGFGAFGLLLAALLTRER